MADEYKYDIKFPGNIILEVHLQKPHPVNLIVRFPDRASGVKFSYSPEGVGKAEAFGPVTIEHGGSEFDNLARPAAISGASAVGSAGTEVAIQYDEPGGSRMTA